MQLGRRAILFVAVLGFIALGLTPMALVPLKGQYEHPFAVAEKPAITWPPCPESTHRIADVLLGIRHDRVNRTSKLL